MSDDIVTRLEKDLFIAIKYANSTALSELLERALHVVRVAEQRRKRVDHMTDEIERLRTIIQDIANAVTDEGIKPGYHKQQVNYVRTMWFPLYEAISKAVKEMDNGTSEP